LFIADYLHATRRLVQFGCSANISPVFLIFGMVNADEDDDRVAIHNDADGLMKYNI